MKVQFTDEAKLCLQDILQFYRSISQTRYGRKIRAKILEKAMKLKDFPELGQIEESLKEDGLGHRYLVEGNYKIIYRKEENTIFITDIFDTRQDPEKMTE